jgi:hypothetical protein
LDLYIESNYGDSGEECGGDGVHSARIVPALEGCTLMLCTAPPVKTCGFKSRIK